MLSFSGWRLSSVTAKRHIQHPVQRLNAPVAPHRLREPLAADVARAHIITDLARLRAVRMRRPPQRIADRLDLRPVRRRREVARHLREEIAALVEAAMRLLLTLIGPVLHVREVALDLLREVRRDGGV